MDLEEYKKEYYKNTDYWFVSEPLKPRNKDKYNKVLLIKRYLDGYRDTDNTLITIDSKLVKPTRTKLNFAEVLLDYTASFLLKNPVTLICDDANTLKLIQEVYKKAKMSHEDIKIYREMKLSGEAYQYLWFDDNNNIKSKILLSENSYPVYTDTGEYVAFIYCYMINMREYYTVYYPDRVEEYNTLSGKINLVKQYVNYSGLPIPFIIPSNLDSYKGKSDVETWKIIIDNMEKLSGKYQDALYKFITGIPVVTGTKLTITKDGKGSINPNVVGQALQLEEGSTFDFKQNKTDYQSMKLMYDNLFNQLLISSCVPAVSMNAQDVSNLSETSIRMMYQLIILKAGMDIEYLMSGFAMRWEQIKRMLKLKYEGIKVNVDGDIDCEFTMEIPSNAKEVIENLKTLREMNGISFETMIAKNPYVADINGEMERIKKEIKENESNINLDNVDINEGVNDDTTEQQE